MKVLLVNTSERIGGAAVAAHRLMESLRRNGVEATMLVRDMQTENPCVASLPQTWRLKWNFLWERVVIWWANRLKRQHLFAVDIANAGTDITAMPEFQTADIIHLHWVNQGMLSLGGIRKILASGKPVVWTMHDMWPLTGICHHARQCDKFRTECHHCPYLYHGGSRKDLSTQAFLRKKVVYDTAPIHFVTCSRWLEEQVGKSALRGQHAVTAIPNPIDTELFRPQDKAAARQRLGLPAEKKLILFASAKITDKRKGIDYMVEACRLLTEKNPQLGATLGVVAVGGSANCLTELLPLPVYPLGYVAEESRLVDIYNAVDLFVTPSLEENLPNIIMESMACGTPCVGFRVGGIPEMIDHQQNGYVAEYLSAEDLAEGILWTLDESRHGGLGTEARQKVLASYAQDAVAKKYMEIYKSLTPRHE